MPHLLEPVLEQIQQFTRCAALEHLGHETAAGLEHVDREIGRRLHQSDNAKVVGRLVTGGPRSQIGEDEVCRAAQRIFQRLVRAFLGEIELQLDRAGNGLDLQKVDARHMRGAAFERNLRPPPGAEPRSATRMPGLIRPNLSSSSVSLYAARER